jgi:hypothetical protein
MLVELACRAVEHKGERKLAQNPHLSNHVFVRNL